MAKKKAKKARQRIWNKKPQWQYDFKTKKYEMVEYRAGVKYQTAITQVQFDKMNDECLNSIERAQWLSKAKKAPKRATSK